MMGVACTVCETGCVMARPAERICDTCDWSEPPGAKKKLLDAVALQRAAEAHLVAMGPCDDAEEDGQESVCMNDDCEYCNLARATQPGVYPPASPGALERLRTGLNAMRDAVKDEQEPQPDCTFCDMPEDMVHHQDPNAKGYHPFNMEIPA